MKSQGALDDEKIYEVAMEQLNESYRPKVEILADEIEQPNIGLAKSFANAIEKKKLADVHSDHTSAASQTAKKPNKSGSIDIKTLF